MKRMIVTVVAAVLVLVGCATDASEPESAPKANASDEATESQVASVIAGYESSWREATDGAGECRITWAIDSPDDPMANVRGTSCYFKEQTATINASLAIRDLELLAIPDSMSGLVAQTVDALHPLATADILEVCGEETWPSSSDECSAALASNFMSFNSLDTILDKWKPYL